MVTLKDFLLIYTLGGLTFIPLVLALVLVHACLTLPKYNPEPSLNRRRSTRAADEHRDATPEPIPVAPELKTRSHEPDVASGYFAVCMEYVPGGVNGKPPERTTPAGAVIGTESPSVYQSMYRSLFDRNRAQSPSLDAGSSRAAKKARNVFFVVLRHGHLVLFDDSEQLEVRHVISLANRSVDVYAGGDRIPEGELWIKRNCIRLLPTNTSLEPANLDPKTLYLFSENTSEKEDFYLALIQNKERQGDNSAALPLYFDTGHIVKLVQQLHASEDHLQTRWINALAGRLFLALYKTEQIQEFIRVKINKKITRVSKPAFLHSISIRSIDMGDSAPLVTNPKLRELTVDGDLTAEIDVSYNGNFRLEIAAVARIDLGSRFKVRHVNLVLAGILKKLEGHVLIRIKPPPSNRFWVSFEHPPKLEMCIEPVVSSRQITYGVILRAIESRIREVIIETLVMPNWDDIPFYDTVLQSTRGGIWSSHSSSGEQSDTPDSAHLQPEDKIFQEDSQASQQHPLDQADPLVPVAKADVAAIEALHRTSATSTQSSGGSSEDFLTSDLEARTASNKPRPLRSGSFASAAYPVVNRDPAVVDSKSKASRDTQDAAAAMKDISARSQPTSPTESPVGSPSSSSLKAKSQASEIGVQDIAGIDGQNGTALPSGASDPFMISSSIYRPTTNKAEDPENTSLDSVASSGPAKRRLTPSGSITLNDRRQSINASLTSATAAAKNWLASRQKDAQPASDSRTTYQGALVASSTSISSQNDERMSSKKAPGEVTRPLGRGQPLPPPGTPLPPPPRPDRKWTPNPLAGLTKRKPVPPPLPRRPIPEHPDKVEETPAPSLPPRKRLSHSGREEADRQVQDKQELFIVAAPEADPVPSNTTPSCERSGSINGDELDRESDGETASLVRDGDDRTSLKPTEDGLLLEPGGGK